MRWKGHQPDLRALISCLESTCTRLHSLLPHWYLELSRRCMPVALQLKYELLVTNLLAEMLRFVGVVHEPRFPKTATFFHSLCALDLVGNAVSLAPLCGGSGCW